MTIAGELATDADGLTNLREGFRERLRHLRQFRSQTAEHGELFAGFSGDRAFDVRRGNLGRAGEGKIIVLSGGHPHEPAGERRLEAIPHRWRHIQVADQCLGKARQTSRAGQGDLTVGIAGPMRTRVAIGQIVEDIGTEIDKCGRRGKRNRRRFIAGDGSENKRHQIETGQCRRAIIEKGMFAKPMQRGPQNAKLPIGNGASGDESVGEGEDGRSCSRQTHAVSNSSGPYALHSRYLALSN